ncbi:MAG: geranylgeranylglycerol-phosphate geranylgeranyltransferase [Bacteroidota bacterium]|nr:geranylgeranylglycerol-phosphate geranylgeranyltransferase [Bacteroidota bacterium]
MPQNKKILLWKALSLFSLTRGYNIFLIALAQYLAAMFILNPQKDFFSVLSDYKLFLLILSSSLCIASGYIVNNFYDTEKDRINRPFRTKFDRLISSETQFRLYFVINLIAVLMAWVISWKAMLFFSGYIFALWFYSHKIKKYALIGNVFATLLMILPFFAILLYYNKVRFPEVLQYREKHIIVLSYAWFLYMLILIQEFLKDLFNIKGDFVNKYNTIAVVYGEKTSKRIITLCVFLQLIPLYILTEKMYVGDLDIYLYLTMFVLSIMLIVLWKLNHRFVYLCMVVVLKILIFLGIISVILMKI